MADPMSLLMLARDNKAEEIKSAILSLGISPNFGNQASYHYGQYMHSDQSGAVGLLVARCMRQRVMYGNRDVGMTSCFAANKAFNHAPSTFVLN